MNNVGVIYNRPWGTYQTINMQDMHQVKILKVEPGKRLSLQYHNHRSEHWIVVNGKGEAWVGDDIFPISENKHVFIPLGVKHRIVNNSSEVLTLIEVQYGSYLGEDDIVRLQDDFNRL